MVIFGKHPLIFLDVIWGLQLQCLNESLFSETNKIKEKRARVKAEKAASPRKIELVCLKNRYGISNYSTYFDYLPANDLYINTGEPAEEETNDALTAWKKGLERG